MIDAVDEVWMRLAIETATRRGSDPSTTPIGAVIVRDGQVLATAINLTEQDHDPTAHAEIVAIRAAGAKIGDMELRGATLYSTLQPCGMCTMATIWAKVVRVVYGAGREDVHPMYFEDRQIDTLDFVRDAWREDLVFEGGCLRDRCAALYYRPGDDVPEDDIGNS